ncbi:MAG TPA: endo-1,4-beta-xylanase [Ruminococcus sp.]
MNWKKIAASLTAIACCGSIVSAMPEFLDETYAAELVYNDFEVTYEGWYANADTADITANPGTGVNGSRGMTVTNRISPEVGASSSKGFYLSGGKEYDYSVQVYSEFDEVFHLSLLCKDETTEEETLVELASKEIKAGEWTEISTKYTAPKNSYEFKLTINNESTNDFSFDNVLITEQRSKNAAKAAPAGKGLKDEFANYGFRVGNILNGGTVKNSAITAVMLKDHNAIECENETKPDATLVQNGSTNTNVKVSLNSCAAIADFCVKNNLGFRGHTLVWHSQTPEWFFKENFNASGAYVNSSVMDQRMESYIKNMFAAFATQYPTLDLYAYDVANECVSDDSNRTANNGGAREPGYGNGKSPWVQVYGSNAFVEKAFTYARKYAPSTCKLYYNDYNEYWDHKRDCIINTIVKPLYEKNLLDGMGMQSHVPANATGFAGTDAYITAMDMYLSIGCDLQISELDISVENGKYSYTDQANKYKAIFQHAMDVNTSGKYKGKVTLVQVWGPNDANSWLSAGSNGLLYDSNNNPKEAYKTLTAMLPDDKWGDGSNVGTTPSKPPEPNEYGWWYQCGFENGDDNWTNRGGNTVSQSDAEHYTQYGSHSLFVSGRTSSWMGAALALDSRIFKAGEAYSFSAHVKQKTEEAVKFMMKIEYTDGSGETAYDEVASVIAPQDTWAQLVNTSYTIPKDASNIKIYIETEESLTSFYIDEAIGAVDGTGIAGEGQPTVKIVILGDVNFDGVINIFDVVAARKYIVSGITDSKVKKAADVDGNGKFEAADLVLIHQYVMGKITEFPEVEIEEKMMTISEYTPLAQASLAMNETADSKQEKAGVQYGTVVSKSYYSNFCKREKKYNVLLPAGYSTDKEYPVMYVMHGYWENQDRMIIKGNGTMYTRQIIGNAIADGAAKDMIVVFPYIYSSQTQNDCSAMDDANNVAYDNFDTVLTTELMPLIEKEYSVKKGRENTAITGFSMGGRESLNIGMKHPDLFGYVGAICPAPGASGAWKFASEEAAPSLIYITAGGNDTVVYNTPEGYHNNFTKNNVPHIWHYYESGYHGDNSIHAHIYNFVRFAFNA